MKPRILCISFSDITTDSRVLRQLNVVKEFGDVTTLSYGNEPAEASSHLRIDSTLPSLPQTPLGVLNLALRRYRAVELYAPAVKSALRLVRNQPFDLIIANEARALPLAHHLAQQNECNNIPIWADLHEWAPEERTHVLSWRLLIKPFMYWLCARYLPRTNALTAVNESIAELYRQHFGCEVEVVRNADRFQELLPKRPTGDTIRLAHSGAAVPGRNLEGMIQAVLDLGEKYTLDLYLVKARDGGRYWQRLKDLSAGSDHVIFHDAVAPDELAETLNQYDLGVYSLPPQTTNHRLMLPNKFFDFVQARLGLVFGPSPETSALINRYGLGLVTSDYSTKSLVAAIKSLDHDDILRFKTNTHKAASELSSAADEIVERNLLTRLLH